MRSTASVAITASGDIGRKMPTRSPLRTPSRGQRVREPVDLARELRVRQRARRAVVALPDHRGMRRLAPRRGDGRRSCRRSSAGRPRTTAATRCRATRRARACTAAIHRKPRSRTTASQYHSGSSTDRFWRASIDGTCSLLQQARETAALDDLGRGAPDDLGRVHGGHAPMKRQRRPRVQARCASSAGLGAQARRSNLKAGR